MGFSKFSRKTSHFYPAYKNDEVACRDISSSPFKTEYIGSGISPTEHPLGAPLRMHYKHCLQCESTNLKVIYAQQSFHPMNGDEYHDIEMVCEDCGSFSIFAYSDND